MKYIQTFFKIFSRFIQESVYYYNYHHNTKKLIATNIALLDNLRKDTDNLHIIMFPTSSLYNLRESSKYSRTMIGEYKSYPELYMRFKKYIKEIYLYELYPIEHDKTRCIKAFAFSLSYSYYYVFIVTTKRDRSSSGQNQSLRNRNIH
jgi:hypothetical protein